MNLVIPLVSVAVLALSAFLWSRSRSSFSQAARIVLTASFLFSLVLVVLIPKMTSYKIPPAGDTGIGGVPVSVSGKVAGLSADVPAEETAVTDESVLATDLSRNALYAVEAYFRQDGGRIDTKDIAFHGIGSSDIDSNAITSRTIQDGSVRSEDLVDHLSIERLNVDESVVARRLSVSRDVVLGSTSVINWGPVSGSDGYGIRNNAGTI